MRGIIACGEANGLISVLYNHAFYISALIIFYHLGFKRATTFIKAAKVVAEKKWLFYLFLLYRNSRSFSKSRVSP